MDLQTSVAVALAARRPSGLLPIEIAKGWRENFVQRALLTEALLVVGKRQMLMT